jgi:hypothetical protein
VPLPRARAYYDEEVLVRTRSLKACANRSFVFSYELVRAETGTLLAEGETTHIVTDSNMKVAALPEKYLTAFRAAVGKKDGIVFLNALHINGNDLTLEAVREVAVRSPRRAAFGRCARSRDRARRGRRHRRQQPSSPTPSPPASAS